MLIKMRYMTTILGTAIIAAAIGAAPIANADTSIIPNQESCVGAVCQSPGNVQINDAPPPAAYYPYGGEAFLLGGSGGFGGGGFHGGGGHR
ncbi:hypothetical protein BST13_17190 [Mycobacterium aquaticum]|uniref:Keratin associated protein n=2 Tax=Mycobacterium aquaticum TaxID=1927124 RepID=A0A1X0AWT1_9MYCO|nr:hypothetical protein BST13_17190 [Mycobacterium aquaticum]